MAWHLSAWDGAARALHAELSPDLHAVWRTQEGYLREQRLTAERQFGADGAAPPELPGTALGVRDHLLLRQL